MTFFGLPLICMTCIELAPSFTDVCACVCVSVCRCVCVFVFAVQCMCYVVARACLSDRIVKCANAEDDIRIYQIMNRIVML